MITVVLGGQYGDEGKGGVVQWLAEKYEFDMVVRFGAPNAGHSCYKDGETFDMQQLPCSWVSSQAPLYLPETALIDKEIFLKEVALVRNHGYKGAIYLSRSATLIDKKDLGWRKRTKEIGSMGSGVAPTRAKRCLREVKKVVTDRDFIEFFEDSSFPFHVLGDPYKRILIEGAQGFGLSLNYGDYPYVTSTDITAQNVLAECGVPLGVHKVDSVMVIRTYPIRVPNPPNGSSGFLGGELTWDALQKRHGDHIKIQYDSRPPVYPTPVAQRVGEFDSALVKRAIWHSRPTVIVLTHLDWIFPNISETGVTKEVEHYLFHLEGSISQRITLLGTSRGRFCQWQR